MGLPLDGIQLASYDPIQLKLAHYRSCPAAQAGSCYPERFSTALRNPALGGVMSGMGSRLCGYDLTFSSTATSKTCS